jgi:hypothetical protein
VIFHGVSFGLQESDGLRDIVFKIDSYLHNHN